MRYLSERSIKRAPGVHLQADAPGSPSVGTVWIDEDDEIDMITELPTQTAQAGRFLSTDGTSPQWSPLPSPAYNLYLFHNYI